MDLATMIAGASADRFKQECTDNVCKINIKVGDGWLYALEVVPLAQHVLVRYKTVEYRMPRADKEAWEELCAFLADATTFAAACAQRHGVGFDAFSMTVARRDKEVFSSEFGEEDHIAEEDGAQTAERMAERVARELKRYMKQLRFLN